MLLDDALDKYPLATRLSDGTPVSVRPLNRRDDVRLQKFFLAVPEEERLFVKQPITDHTLSGIGAASPTSNEEYAGLGG